MADLKRHVPSDGLDEFLRGASEAFGPCTRLYECMEHRELVESITERPDESAADWLDAQLRVEDACGTPIALLAKVEERVCVLLDKWGLERLNKPTKYRELDCELDLEYGPDRRGTESVD